MQYILFLKGSVVVKFDKIRVSDQRKPWLRYAPEAAQGLDWYPGKNVAYDLRRKVTLVFHGDQMLQRGLVDLQILGFGAVF